MAATSSNSGNVSHFAPEIWHIILSHLWVNEDDSETILSCRLVCQAMKELVDKMPAKLHWNPWFYPIRQSNDTLTACPWPFNLCPCRPLSTKFENDDSVDEFLKGLPQPGSPGLGKNPFNRNQTVMLCNSKGTFKKEEKSLQMIFEEYGHHIKKFVYSPSTQNQSSWADLLQLLKTMTTLQTLMITINRLVGSEMLAISEEIFPKDFNLLRELVIVHASVLDIPTPESKSPFTKFSVNIGAQIRFLTVEAQLLDFVPGFIHFLNNFPNLEALKLNGVFCVGTEVLQIASGISLPKLRQLALAKSKILKQIEWLRDAAQFSTCFASTLELLSLDVTEPENYFHSPDSNMGAILGLGSITYWRIQNTTPFSKLTKLILPFWLVSERQVSGDTLENYFHFQFPQLKSLVLQDSRNEFKNRDFKENELKGLFEKFWRIVPPSVEIISLRTERHNKVLSRSFPVLFKCHKNCIDCKKQKLYDVSPIEIIDID